MKIIIQEKRVIVLALSDEELVKIERALDAVTNDITEDQDPAAWRL